jgi:hypothetical protein
MVLSLVKSEMGALTLIQLLHCRFSEPIRGTRYLSLKRSRFSIARLCPKIRWSIRKADKKYGDSFDMIRILLPFFNDFSVITIL